LTEIDLLAPELTSRLWTLREGKHNSFPFLQLKRRDVPDDTRWRKQQVDDWRKMKPAERRQGLRALAARFPFRGDWLDKWPGQGMRSSLQRRQAPLEVLRDTEAAAVPAAIERFLSASQRPRELLNRLLELCLDRADEGESDWLDAAHRTLIEGCAFYVDVLRGEFARDVADPKQIGALSRALPRVGDENAVGLCALTGNEVALLQGNFPQPHLPLLGPTYLFAKNGEIPAAGRYDRSSVDAFPIGSALVERLAEALRELTAEHRRGRSWSVIPSERPKQSDLLLAFVPAAPDGSDVRVTDMIAEDEDPGYQRASFMRRTQRLIDAVKARVGEDFRKTPVKLCVLRRVDPANRKVIYHRAITVAQLWDAASQWAEGERNLPDQLRLLIPRGRGEKAEWRSPSHVAPLQLPALTRSRYIRGGTTTEEVVGLSARDAFALFLNDRDLPRQALSALRLTMHRHGPLLSGSAHALRRGIDHVRGFDRSAALRSLTLLGVLLSKLGRRKEAYMEATAFKLGQLLAVADVVHVGYCADRRGGEVPPVLLGNSVLAMAQSNPVRALAVLCRRWKPYGAWAKQPNARALAEVLRKSKDPNEVSRGWAIVRGRSQASRAAELTQELHGHLLVTTPSDAFRAELLLGYIAGLPRREAEDVAEDNRQAEGE
jgi:hypothetical protein